MKKTHSFGLTLAFLLTHTLALAVWSQAVNAQPVTITVPDDYPTIQEAINHASYGDTVYVKAGTYYEAVTVNKTLVLRGENRRSIIDGRGGGGGVLVTGWNVTIDGFTIRNGGDFFGGIWILSSEAKIVNNNITHNGRGIELEKTRQNLIWSNYITNNIGGIHGESLSDSAISGNIIANNLWGIFLSESVGNAINSNHIRNHRDNGISLWGSHENVVVGNNILLNNEGDYSSAITIGHSSNNKFHHNNIINRGKQVDVTNDTANIWDDDYPFGGNYWSDYNGSDLYRGLFQNVTGSDGLGDTPYTIATENVDRYPLAHPNPQVAGGLLNLTEYYEDLSRFVNLQSKYDNLLSRQNLLQQELDDLESEFNSLQTEHGSLTNELNLTRNIVYALLVTTTVFVAATAFLSTRKLKAEPSGPSLATKLKGSITSANKRFYAMASSSLNRFSVTSLGAFYVFLTAIDIAQTLWSFPEHEVGILAKAFIVFFNGTAWLYFPFRIILTTLIVVAIVKLMSPGVSKSLFLILSLMTLAAVIWNTYFLMMPTA